MNVLGKYVILEQLGTGAMGTVYRAKDPVLDREVALKTIRTSGTVNSEIRRRFYREARACARLQHPHIVSVYEMGEVDQIAFISMELLRGSDLRRLIDRKPSIGVAEKINVMIQICEGLDHAHRHGVIHRDIKPSNIFLQENGRVKIVDFGIARLPSSRVTVQGMVLGTPNYMAPEQIRDLPTDARSDLFSAGLVFFELLVYVHAFQGASIHTRITEGEPDSLFDHDTTLPVLLDEIMSRTLAKDPNNRYGSCGEMADDLRAVLDGIRNNASPSMSKVELPSRRAPFRPQPQIDGDPALLKPAPAGENPAEWRLSEVLRLIPEFEEATERRNELKARKALEELKAIATVDRRFVEAAESCLQSYKQLWGGDPEQPAEPAAMSASDVVRPNPPAGVPEKPLAGVNKWKAWATSFKLGRIELMGAAACFVLILFGWAASRVFGTAAEEPALGTAAVVIPSSYIRAAPAPEAEIVSRVSAGERVRLLDLPATSSASWLRVQAIRNEKAEKPGYIQKADVADWKEWSLDTVESAVRLAFVMRPEDSASEEQLGSFLTKLRALQGQAAGKAEEERVRTEIEVIEKLIAQKRTPQPATEVPSAVVEPVQLTADQLVARGDRALTRQDTKRARYYALEALKLDKDHKGARELLENVNENERAFTQQ
jgi:serine/threonine-protein kinase